MNIDKVNSTGTVQNLDTRTESKEIGKTKIAESVDSFQLGKAVDILNEKASKENYDVRFSVYKDSNRIFIEVVDKTNNQVISTFPPKQILEMALMVDKEFKVLDKKI
jgi:flagellar protein FlaG